MGIGTFLLIVAIALLVLVPTRRLFLAGWSEGALATYFVAMVALGVLVAELRGPTRYLVPILVLAYVAPYVTFRAGMARLGGRHSPRPVVRPAPIRHIEAPSGSAPPAPDQTAEPAAAKSEVPVTAQHLGPDEAEPEEEASEAGRR